MRIVLNDASVSSEALTTKPLKTSSTYARKRCEWVFTYFMRSGKRGFSGKL